MATAHRCWVAGAMCFLMLGPADAQERPSVGLPAGAVARLGQTRLRHANKATCVAFAPDGKTFVTGGEDGAVRVWSVATGEQVAAVQKSGRSVSAVRFTHGGTRLAVDFNDGLIRLCDPVTLSELESTPFLMRFRFAFSTDGALLATSHPSGNAVVTETANDLPKLELTRAEHFAFRPDGKAIAVGDAKGDVVVYLVTGGKPIRTLKHEGAITGLVYNSNGSRLAIGTRTANGADAIRVYAHGKKPIAEIAGVSIPKVWIGDDSLACGSDSDAGVYDLTKREWSGRVKGVAGEFAVSPDGTKLAATGSGLRVRLWDLATAKEMHAENDSFPEPALLVGSADGRTLFLMSGEKAYLWAIGADGAKPAGTLPGRAVAAATSRDKLVVATPNAVIVYENFDPTKPLPAKPTHAFKDSTGAEAVAISANGTRVAWAVDGGKVVVTNAAGRGARRELPDNSAVFALGFNPAGDRLGVLGRDPFFRVWDVSGEVKAVWKARGLRGRDGAVAFSPDGKLVTAVSTAQLLVFDAADGKAAEESRQPLSRYSRHIDQGVVQHAVFTPDGRFLVVGSGGASGRVEVWNVETRERIRTFATGYGGTSRLCVFPDGKRAASAGAEEAVTVWDLTRRDTKQEEK